MKQFANNPRCEEFHSQLADIIGSGEMIANHPHLQTCELCRALFADLNVIAQAARELFPVQDPPVALWGNIESAIAKQDGLHRR